MDSRGEDLLNGQSALVVDKAAVVGTTEALAQPLARPEGSQCTRYATALHGLGVGALPLIGPRQLDGEEWGRAAPSALTLGFGVALSTVSGEVLIEAVYLTHTAVEGAWHRRVERWVVQVELAHDGAAVQDLR